MMDVPWLTDDEQAVWRSFLAATRQVRRETERQLIRDSGMAGIHYAILVSLSEAPRRVLRMSELAEAVGGTQSQVSHAVSTCERRGWITRQPCSEDGRGSNASLTDAGMVALEAAAPGHVACVRRLIFDVLDPAEQQQLRDLTDRIADSAQ